MPEASDYERYLHTAELLALQKPAAERVHRDELLFQVVHQSSELWLKLAAFETAAAAVRLRDGDLAGAAPLLQRALLGLRLITEQLEMLEHIAPRDYHLLRSALGQGSGFDSPGFRALQEVARDVGAAFLAHLQLHALPLAALYAEPERAPEAYRVAELLTDWDQQLGLWRARHLNVVERLIGGAAVGTQGTPIALLRELGAQRAFPALWAARDELARAMSAQRPPQPQRAHPPR
ncbi:tryptophan 2,3-dioxygenase [Candidatus Binatia bacterium]|jgi:tryptophan 2,3-dioxygenase|nr:tryptophan 2,3-dioxygenase [Candidatus Binatia bacterium]